MLAIRPTYFAPIFFLYITSATASEGREFPDFASFRNEVLNLIGGANTRVWLSTDYLTDGEMVSSLYLAKYRGMNVSVLLGVQKARAYMSRLDYLKKQGIRVNLRPRSFPFSEPSLLLIDQTLFKADSDLNFMTSEQGKRGAIRLTQADPAEFDTFVAAFNAAEGQAGIQGSPAVPTPNQNMHNSSNRKGTNQESIAPMNSSQDNTQLASSPAASGSGVFFYDRHGGTNANERGIAKRLPKEPLYMKRNRSAQAPSSDQSLQQRYPNLEAVVNPYFLQQQTPLYPISPESY